MLTEVTGLILRSVNVGESDRLITVFTKEMGNVTAMVKGARSLRNKNMPSTQQYCYSSIILYKKGDKLWVRESNLIEGFFGIRESLDRLGLAGYIVEVLSEVTTAEPDAELLRLSLNCLYAISSGKYPLEKIKAAFEIRALSIIGFMPEVLSCRDCHKSSSDFFFDIMGGNIQCRACRDDYILKNPIIDPASTESRIVTLLSEGARTALAYLVHCPQERLFSFSVSDEDMKLVSNACEEYLVNQLERSFKSLDFYKEVRH
ncbi:MAG: DNA repair protein RecO [Clostridia bacterium]|nr:DNA repair protein RecO [Clostridia bacterium]